MQKSQATFFLNGGGFFSSIDIRACFDALKKNSIPAEHSNALVISQATQNLSHSWNQCRQDLSDAGINTITSCTDVKSTFHQNLTNSTFLLIDGGDQKRLLHWLSQMNRTEAFFEWCENPQHCVIALSAGAHVLGSEMPYEKELFQSLGILPLTLVETHFTERRRIERLALLENEMKVERIIALNENTTVGIVGDKIIPVNGTYTLYKRKKLNEPSSSLRYFSQHGDFDQR